MGSTSPALTELMSSNWKVSGGSQEADFNCCRCASEQRQDVSASLIQILNCPPDSGLRSVLLLGGVFNDIMSLRSGPDYSDESRERPPLPADSLFNPPLRYNSQFYSSFYPSFSFILGAVKLQSDCFRKRLKLFPELDFKCLHRFWRLGLEHEWRSGTKRVWLNM